MDHHANTIEDIPVIIVPIHWEFNLWGFLGLLCVLSSAFLSGTILVEVVQYLVAG